MSKAILIIDIDEKKYNSNVTSISFENKETIFFMKDIKLKPIPSKLPSADIMKVMAMQQGINIPRPLYTEEYEHGYNDCLDEILGDEK